ncbi:MAG: PH domain-containing protein [Solirubrobacteraceae bacterium]
MTPAATAHLIERWTAWAQNTFGPDAARTDEAVKAALAALAGGATPQQAAAMARDAAWKVWAAQRFEGDPVRAAAAGEAIRAARASGADAAHIVAAADAAARAVQGNGAQTSHERSHQQAVHPSRAGDASRTRGAYEYLIKDKSELSQQALALIDRLEMTHRPRVVAFLGRRATGPYSRSAKVVTRLLLLALLVWILIVATHVEAVRKIDGPVTPAPIGSALVVSLVLGLLCVGTYLLHAATTRYTLARGRLTVESGLLARNRRSLELYRVTNVALHRSMMNRITGDGSLVLTYTGPDSSASERIPVTGLQGIRDLRVTGSQLEDLAFTLRSNAVIQRFMQ